MQCTGWDLKNIIKYNLTMFLFRRNNINNTYKVYSFKIENINKNLQKILTIQITTSIFKYIKVLPLQSNRDLKCIPKLKYMKKSINWNLVFCCRRLKTLLKYSQSLNGFIVVFCFFHYIVLIFYMFLLKQRSLKQIRFKDKIVCN